MRLFSFIIQDDNFIYSFTLESVTLFDCLQLADRKHRTIEPSTSLCDHAL